MAFMDSWLDSQKRLPVEMTALPQKATQQFGSQVTPIRWDRMLKASQRPGCHQVLKLATLQDSLRSRATLAPEEAWQSDPLPRAFSALELRRSAPWHD
jgi:hypothetical protein